MKIAIDTNEVLRSFLDQFSLYYKKGIDRKFDIDNIIYDDINLRVLFPFESDYQLNSFLYEDFVLEIFGHAKQKDGNTIDKFNNWTYELEDLDIDEEIELTIISIGESHKSIPSTMFFFSKTGCICKNYEFSNDIEKLWEKYDLIVTANNQILDLKPENKKSVKINTDFNKEIESTYSFESFKDFMKDESIILNLK